MDFELKKWRLDYVKDIAKYANNKKIADNLRNAFPYPYTEDDAKRYINHCIIKRGGWSGLSGDCCRRRSCRQHWCVFAMMFTLKLQS